MINESEIYKAFMADSLDIAVKFNMFDEKERVLVGVSGGPDSMALLLFLLKIKEKYSLKIGIAHLNHMLRGKEADRDEEFVQNFAQQRNLPCFIEKKDVAMFAKRNHMSMEDAARSVRYSFLKDVLEKHKYSKIAVGHTFNDNAELILMNILRGSGTKGLSGITPKREDFIIRPLITTKKQTVLKFLESVDQKYMIDTSNKDEKYLRNSIRNTLIPLIEEKYNPKIKESLVRLSTIIKDEDEWMTQETELLFNKAIKSIKPDLVELSIDSLDEYHTALRKRVVRKAVKKINGSLKKISLKHIDDVIKLSLSTAFGESIDLPDKIRVFKKKRSIFFKKESIPLRELGKQRKIERKRGTFG